MPVLRKFLNDVRKELVIVLVVLGACMFTMLSIWYMYSKKIDAVDTKIENVKHSKL